MTEEAKRIEEALAAPFDSKQLKWKPGVVKGQKALALVYVDARLIQDRLDSVLGVTGWQDEYEFQPDGSAICKLRLRIDGEWICKSDVGGPSEQPAEGDRRKAAVSDALKRTAVKFGVARYLYRFPGQWVEYDPQKRQFLKQPAMPASPVASQAQAKPANGKAPAKAVLPADGAELSKRLFAHDAKLAAEGLCPVGALVRHLVEKAVKAGNSPDIVAWDAALISWAVSATKFFEASLRKAKAPASAPAQPPERPYDTDMDEAEAINEAMVAYLEWLTRAKGFTVDALARRFGASSLAALSVGDYRLAIAGLSNPVVKR